MENSLKLQEKLKLCKNKTKKTQKKLGDFKNQRIYKNFENWKQFDKQLLKYEKTWENKYIKHSSNFLGCLPKFSVGNEY